MARDLASVIGQMLKIIPASEEDLISGLKSVQSSARYAAPEMMLGWWKATAAHLASHMPQIKAGWQRNVLDIWIDKTAKAERRNG